jgi:ComF family protein
MLEKLWENFLDLLFPPHCVNCGEIGNFFCADCSNKILKIKSQTCPFCKKLSKNGKTCPTCHRKYALDAVISFGYFKDPALKEIIHNYKYLKISALAEILSSFLVESITKEGVEFDAVSFAPITKKRESWRGYNQAELLAEKVAKEFNKPLIKLIKTKETKTQVGLTRKERIKNLESAFRLERPEEVAQKRVLLIDDVVTTGTTLNECALVLKKGGAKAVYGVVIAKE